MIMISALQRTLKSSTVDSSVPALLPATNAIIDGSVCCTVWGSRAHTAGGANFFCEWGGAAGLDASTPPEAAGMGRNVTGVAELLWMRQHKRKDRVQVQQARDGH